jgi:hypothetical protein
MDMDAQAAVRSAQCNILHHTADLYARHAQTAFSIGAVRLLRVAAEKEPRRGQIRLNVRANGETYEKLERGRSGQRLQRMLLSGIGIDVREQIADA